MHRQDVPVALDFHVVVGKKLRLSFVIAGARWSDVAVNAVEVKNNGNAKTFGDDCSFVVASFDAGCREGFNSKKDWW